MIHWLEYTAWYIYWTYQTLQPANKKKFFKRCLPWVIVENFLRSSFQNCCNSLRGFWWKTVWIISLSLWKFLFTSLVHFKYPVVSKKVESHSSPLVCSKIRKRAFLVLSVSSTAKPCVRRARSSETENIPFIACPACHKKWKVWSLRHRLLSEIISLKWIKNLSSANLKTVLVSWRSPTPFSKFRKQYETLLH